MSRQVSPSTDRVYGLQRVTRIWGVSRATVYRHRRQPKAIARRRPGPLGAMADEELVRAIRQLLQDSPFHGEGYRKLWARLRFAGIRTSRRRVLRLMREHGLLAHQRAGRPRGSRAHDGTITTERVDLMWGTDLTTVDHRRGPSGGVHHGRSLLGRMRRPPRQPQRRSLRGARADPSGRARALRRLRQERSQRSRPSPRSRLPVREPPLPGRDPLPRHRKLAGLRPRARRKWLRRALHPGAEGKPAVGPAFRHARGAAPGAPGVQANLQPDLDHRAARLPDPSPGPSRSARSDRPWPRKRRSVSQSCGPVHSPGLQFAETPLCR